MSSFALAASLLRMTPGGTAFRGQSIQFVSGSASDVP